MFRIPDEARSNLSLCRELIELTAFIKTFSDDYHWEARNRIRHLEILLCERLRAAGLTKSDMMLVDDGYVVSIHEGHVSITPWTPMRDVPTFNTRDDVPMRDVPIDTVADLDRTLAPA